MNDLGEAGAKSRKKNTTPLARKENSPVGGHGNKKIDQHVGWEKNTNQQVGQEKKILRNFMLGFDALNMDIHGFYIQFRYKS